MAQRAQNLPYVTSDTLEERTTSTAVYGTEREQHTGGTVRALEMRDLPAVVALRLVAFRHSERRTAEALEGFFRTIFFENPWLEAEQPSLVYENERGEVAGFLGVLPRRMIADGRDLRVAVGTQLMVAPSDRGLVGRRLMRAFMDGPYDLCLGDTANDTAQRLWTSLGGHTSPLLSLSWVRPLRPWSHALRRLGTGAIAKAVQAAAYPLCSVLDGPARRTVLTAPGAASTVLPLTPETICEDQTEVFYGFAIQPKYEPRSLEWLLALAAEKRLFGQLHSARVRDDRGEPLGWFLYYLDGDRMAHVLQIAARRKRGPQMLQRLFRDAWERGALAVSGRAEPWLMSTLLSTDRLYVYQGPWTLLHSRSGLSEMVERGAAYLSRLDGEWWLSF